MQNYNKNNYDLCYENLCIEFAKHDPEEMANKSGAKYNFEKKEFTLTYLNREYIISYPQGRIVLKNDTQRNLFRDNVMKKMLIISYFHRCTKATHQNKWVPYRELDGAVLYNVSGGITTNKLSQFFGHKGDLFLKVGHILGAKKISYGDIALKIDVFPNIPIILVLWLADDELEANSNMLYDPSVVKELHPEDVALLSSLLIDEVIEIAKQISE
ncbi:MULTISPECIES: DUF3786 domain-containing protein [Clostridium]|uniref:DUF3786 domain-containing protein n=4 Tax=Clostridium TaxID=1485 RepID=D8GR17_CLOLD|nr:MULTISPECIES: DUF3786 domain-containing protein [Clostridium]ADK16322.1 conserved hypothetical protein [Clostridium ljungdahlii DSM 13528]AGY75399.1 DUF3786 domain-containing protein [Clostridium autoethanogenum DSM 10061]ALU35565.1 Hypothetical protein CLAU_1136 [Clostridium autoethanogenum DSM 10061]OAA89805.1 hypothetical protein WX45_01642 [Clostridium ljungdahlii DSM 13528]OAA94695.1 hypothetical protein WX73_02407 [Clostridium coskatii]